MNLRNNKTLYRKLREHSFSPRHGAEVGVYHPRSSNIYDYILDGIRCTLVEPDPTSVALIKQHFSDFKNVTLYPYAIYDHSGNIELTQREASTFITALPDSPSLTNDLYKRDEADTFIVAAKTFDSIDDGSIDLISIDIEGGEWFVLKHMTSRPIVISLETHGGAYVNPYLNEIKTWMDQNGYRIYYKDTTDTVYVSSTININLMDQIRLFVMDFYILFRRARKILKNTFLS